MKRTSFLIIAFFALGAFPRLALADPPLTIYEKALYDKARYQVLSKVGDDDFAAYCVSMNVGGDTLLRLHDDVMAKQAELDKLQNEGLANDHPEILSVTSELRDLKSQYSLKIAEARKALELESNIADATLASLTQK
jgi:hypothetical protein